MIRILAPLVLVLAAVSVPPTTAASAAAGQAIDVLVIGDSYSAGNGATGTTYGPSGCYRNTTHWGERYAAGLRQQGYDINLTNHACSGGRTPDVHTARAMDTQANRIAPAPAGITTTDEADAHLRSVDPCNTKAFPAEEFWTYRASAVIPGVAITYDCTRNLRPQADFATRDTDLVVFTMGGNDAGFSTIVQGCFVVATRTAAACRTAVDAARALIPTIKQRLLEDVAALRAKGLREDARIVQLGYPWLQVDNGFTLTDPSSPTPYAAGDAVRALITDATAQLATVPAAANVGHPGQMSFIGGVTTKFSGHEPDAGSTNPQTWINEQLSGPDTNIWYHPNDLGQIAYSELLLAGGTYGATPGPNPTTTPPVAGQPSAELRAHPTRHRFAHGRPVTLRVRVRLSDGSVPVGRIVVQRTHHRRVLKVESLRAASRGHLRVRVRGIHPGRTRLVVKYGDRVALLARDRVTVRVARRSAR